MTQLQVISFEGQLVTESRQVAEMVGKLHSNLMRDIHGYKEVLDQNSNLNSADFFIESTYKNENNQTYPCYLLTKQGCEMVANKMTGEKGILFTATYVTKFNEMEKGLIPKPITPSELALLQAQNMVALEKRVEEQAVKIEALEAGQENISNIIRLNPVEWRKKVTNILNKIGSALGGFEAYRNIKNESYKLLEERAHCNLERRLTNRRKEMALNGATKSKRDKISKLDIIADDQRLLEIYLAIVKEMAIEYRINVDGLGA